MSQLVEKHGRRDFCKRLASAAACTGGLALLPGCSSGNSGGSIPGSPLTQVSGALVGGAVVVTIGAGSPLAATGAMALVVSPAGNFLVTRTGDTTFLALTAQCTHAACVVSGATAQTYVCPCHGSEFDTSGRVVVGPASVGLRQFPTQFASNVLTIT
jgi:cytochrome b6-f complex iron-sulfur subunit